MELAELTDRQRSMLAALAANDDATYAPVQVQKLFFLIDENLAADLGGKLFSFEPYDYGPFDKNVYAELEALERAGLVEIVNRASRRSRRYRLTAAGNALGGEACAVLRPEVQDYLRNAAKWVCSLSFAELVGAIYKAYPRMKQNSIFGD
ncbi:MAG: hypothetical protein AAFX08_09240 [Pseudomonadota bacterium]